MAKELTRIEIRTEAGFRNVDTDTLKVLQRSTKELSLSVRALNALQDANCPSWRSRQPLINTIAELIETRETDLLGRPGMGPKTLNEIKKALAIPHSLYW